MWKRQLLCALLILIQLGALTPGLAAQERATPEWAAPAQPQDLILQWPVYELQLNSVIRSQEAGISILSEVKGSVLIPHPDDPQGCADTAIPGTAEYVRYETTPAVPCPLELTDGYIRVTDAPILKEDGEKRLSLIVHGGLWHIHRCPIVPITGIHWYSGWIVAHQDELSPRGLDITNWTFPGGDVYARKTYDRTVPVGQVQLSEDTELLILRRPPAVKIEEIWATGESAAKGCSPMSGASVTLQADLTVPDAYEVLKYVWSGDAPTGVGDKDNKGLYAYTPSHGVSGGRDGHGAKTVNLTVTYRHKESGAKGCVRKSYNYIVYFDLEGDDDGDGIPNWFEYWGKDGALPGLDAPDVVFDPTTSRGDAFYSWKTDQITFTPKAVRPRTTSGLTLPEAPNCPYSGETFGSGEYLERAAIALVHERHHDWQKEQYDIPQDQGGWQGLGDSDGDLLPDQYETDNLGTSPSNPDSCNIDSQRFIDNNNNGIPDEGDYRPYKDLGDLELGARLVHGQATYNWQKDYGYPGLQTRDWCRDGNGSSALADPARPTGTTAPLPFELTPMDVVGLPVQLHAPPDLPADVGALTGSYGERGVDQDNDGRFERLEIDVGLQVTQGAPLSLGGVLEDGAGRVVAQATVPLTLTQGIHQVALPFDGGDILRSGLDGPYTLSEVVLRVAEQYDATTVDAATNAHATAPYAHTAFEGPAATLSGVLSEEAQDTDGDGLNDRLRVRVGLDVTESGTFAVAGQLAAGDVTLMAHSERGHEPGQRTIAIDFDGAALYQTRQNGPYELIGLWLRDANGELLDVAIRPGNTAAYAYDTWTHGTTRLEPAGYGTLPVDTDGDGQWNGLNVELAMTTNRSQVFGIAAVLRSSSGARIAEASAVLVSDPQPNFGGGDLFQTGTFTGTLTFDGGDIYLAGQEGPYVVDIAAVRDPDGEPVDAHPAALTTFAYQATDFDSPIKARIALPMVLRTR